MTLWNPDPLARPPEAHESKCRGVTHARALPTDFCEAAVGLILIRRGPRGGEVYHRGQGQGEGHRETSQSVETDGGSSAAKADLSLVVGCVLHWPIIARVRWESLTSLADWELKGHPEREGSRVPAVTLVL